MEIARLAKRHVRERFSCGDAHLDEFLLRYAQQNERRGLSRTYVATRPDADDVVGFVTIRVGEVACADLPPEERRRLPRYPVSVLHVARLAVDETARGERVGERLLLHVLRKAVDVAAEAGLWGIEVLAKGAAARGFYEHYGFAPLVDDPLHLYLSMKTVRKALS